MKLLPRAKAFRTYLVVEGLATGRGHFDGGGARPPTLGHAHGRLLRPVHSKHLLPLIWGRREHRAARRRRTVGSDRELKMGTSARALRDGDDDAIAARRRELDHLVRREATRWDLELPLPLDVVALRAEHSAAAA